MIYKNLSTKPVARYLLYALGEIILVVIGILIAININERIANNVNNDMRCEYLNELKFTFEYDIIDVEENIEGFEKWNPKLGRYLLALQENRLIEPDSLYDLINTAVQFIYFGQRSVSKIEELKYSNINLIKDRNLKNKILLYQDQEIMYLRIIENKYNLVDEERRQYFSKNIFGLKQITYEKLKDDNQFYSVIFQKYAMNMGMEKIYRNLLKEQYEIKSLIDSVLKNNCDNTKKI